MIDVSTYSRWLEPISLKDTQPAKLLKRLELNTELVQILVETHDYYLVRQLYELQLIKSLFNDPKSGKLVIGFKLVKPVPMVASLYLYLVYGSEESEEKVEELLEKGEKQKMQLYVGVGSTG